MADGKDGRQNDRSNRQFFTAMVTARLAQLVNQHVKRATRECSQNGPSGGYSIQESVSQSEAKRTLNSEVLQIAAFAVAKNRELV